jgi:hypothetical protein
VIARRGAAALAILLLAFFAGPARAARAESAHPGAEAQSLAALGVATLAERIAKLQAQAAQGVLAERARRALSQALRRFDAAVHGLGRPALPAELHENVAILALIAKEYHAWALKSPTRDNARGLAERADEVAWVAAKAARLYAPGAPSSAARAEEAAALAQRASRLAFLRHWQAGGSAGEELARIVVRLHGALDALHAAPATADTDAELQVADNQAAFLFAALGDADKDPHALETAAKAADNMQESMERLSALNADDAR